jgi:hypothetical protein
MYFRAQNMSKFENKTNSTPLHKHASVCPKPGPGFTSTYVVVVFGVQRFEVKFSYSVFFF